MHTFRLLWEFAANKRPGHAILGFDREADVNSARLLAWVFLRRTVSEAGARRTGLALHYAYGAMIGAFYAALSSRVPQIRSGQGVAFGALLWLIGDEIPVSVSGISNPFQKMAASHAGALAAHLLFGAAVESIIGVTRQEFLSIN